MDRSGSNFHKSCKIYVRWGMQKNGGTACRHLEILGFWPLLNPNWTSVRRFSAICETPCGAVKMTHPPPPPPGRRLTSSDKLPLVDESQFRSIPTFMHFDEMFPDEKKTYEHYIIDLMTSLSSKWVLLGTTIFSTHFFFMNAQISSLLELDIFTYLNSNTLYNDVSVKNRRFFLNLFLFIPA